MATYIYRSAKTGKIVTEGYAKKYPDLTTKERVKEPRKPKVVKAPEPVIEAPVEEVVEIAVEEPVSITEVVEVFVSEEMEERKAELKAMPATNFFKVGKDIIEVTPKGNVRHWRQSGVRCNEFTDIDASDGIPMTKHEIAVELW